MTSDLTQNRIEFSDKGFTILPGFISTSELVEPCRQLARIYPSAERFHRDLTARDAAPFVGDQFAGIRSFPFESSALNLLAVHPSLTTLAEALLNATDIRIYSAELWMKYTDAVDYDQLLHRDYLNHTLLVPSPDSPQDQVEMFLFLNDVPESLGPPHFLPRNVSTEAAPFPNWIAKDEKPDWYAVEESAAGPAGTVVAYGIDTFHRGTNLIQAGGSRATIHVSFRRAATEWASRIAWADHSFEDAWREFVAQASLRQLLLFGFPPPRHPYWTEKTLADLSLRYPGLDVDPFT